MSRPVRLKLSRAKGFNLQAVSLATNGLPVVIVSRPSMWGNPFQVGVLKMFVNDDDPTDVVWLCPTNTQEAVDAFRWLVSQRNRRDMVADKLRGKNLACWCALDAPCHADVLLEIANRPICEAVAPSLKETER